MSLLHKFLLSDIYRNDNLDDPQSTIRIAQVIKSKLFLYNLYTDYYHWFKNEIGSTSKKRIVELGSGGGFIKEIMPAVITSDVLKLPFVDKQFSALSMPFHSATVDTFVMINVLHHLKDVKKFFQEVNRCLRPGGKLLAIEPANTLWGRFVYQHFHHEVFDPEASWTVKGSGPVSDANGALPWIILGRDRTRFENLFPQLKIKKMIPHTPLRYLLSGGLTYKQLAPNWSYPVVNAVEKVLTPFNSLIGMFYKIEIIKQKNH